MSIWDIIPEFEIFMLLGMQSYSHIIRLLGMQSSSQLIKVSDQYINLQINFILSVFQHF